MQSSTLTGTLMFTGSGYIKPGQDYQPRPWPLVQKDGSETDLHPILLAVFKNMHGKYATQERGPDFYRVTRNLASAPVFDYNDGFPILRTETGFSNVTSYLKMVLVWLTGRKVFIHTNDNEIAIEADRSESVYGVHCREDTSDCPVPADKALTICGVEKETGRCIFSRGVVSGEFFCDKFDHQAEELLDYYATSKIPAPWTRIGNCAFLGKAQ